MPDATNPSIPQQTSKELSMRKLVISSVAVTATALMGATGLVATTTSSASAQDSPVDVVSVSGHAAIAYNGQYVHLKARITAPSTITSWYVTSADVYKGSRKVGTTSYPIASGGGTDFAVKFTNSWGRGKMTIRNAHISAYTASTHYEYVDTSFTGTFTVKSASTGKLPGGNAIHIESHGARKKFKVGLKYFSASGWKPWKHHKVQIQMRKHGHWKTIKKLKLNKRGVAHWHRTSRAKHTYRLRAHSTSTIAGGKTSGIKI
jgi:hypothetical protein